MSDIAHASARTSSLATALANSHSQNDTYVLDMKKSPAQAFVETVSTSANTDWDAAKVTSGGSVSLAFSKLGICTRAYIRVSLQMAIDIATGATTTFSNNLVAAMIQSLTLSTHSREIASIDSVELARLIHNHKARDLLQEAGGYYWGSSAAHGTAVFTPAGGVAVATNNDPFSLVATGREVAANVPEIHIMIPLLFTSLRGDPKSGLNTAFCESIKCTMVMRPKGKFYTGNAAVTGARFQLLQKYHVPTSKVYQATIAKTYPPGRSAQVLYNQAHILARKDVIPTGYKKSKMTIKLSSSSVSLLRGVSVYAIRTALLDGADQFQNNFMPISGLRFSGSGRQLINVGSAAEAALLGLPLDDYAPTNQTGIRATSGVVTDLAVQQPLPESNILQYSFCSSSDPSYHSGSLSLSGIASQSWEVDVNTGTDLLAGAQTTNYPFSVFIVGSCVEVKSIASSSGAITNSLSV